MRLYVSLRREEFDWLTTLARAERRRPQDQAAVLIERALANRHAYSGVTTTLASTPRQDSQQVAGDERDARG
jgi:hypothetical protein